MIVLSFKVFACREWQLGAEYQLGTYNDSFLNKSVSCELPAWNIYLLCLVVEFAAGTMRDSWMYWTEVLIKQWLKCKIDTMRCLQKLSVRYRDTVFTGKANLSACFSTVCIYLLHIFNFLVIVHEKNHCRWTGKFHKVLHFQRWTWQVILFNAYIYYFTVFLNIYQQ